jgi:glycosyltransferase involved in cell wall biosynthesis
LSSLSVIVITKNEERNIRECLESVAWAGEIVVVDAGSADRTVEIAKTVTPKVYVDAWKGYGAARNEALTHCDKEWVLWLDADERVTPALAAEIKSAVASAGSDVAGYEVPRAAYFLGRWIKHCGWYPAYVVRLFRRGAGRFTEDKVHEKLEVDGQIRRLKSDLLHFTDPNLFHYFEKFNRYTSLAAEELLAQRRKFRLSQLLLRPAWVFMRMYIVQRGIFDGLQGFILSLLSSFYVFVKYAKLWELSHTDERSKLQ